MYLHVQGLLYEFNNWSIFAKNIIMSSIFIKEENLADAGHNWYRGTVAIDPVYESGNSIDNVINPILNKYKGYVFKGLTFDLGGSRGKEQNSLPVEIVVATSNDKGAALKSIRADISISDLFYFSKMVVFRIAHDSDFMNDALNWSNIEGIEEGE